jgi:hypothetical protein
VKYDLLQNLARELVVEDPTRVVCVRKNFAFFGSTAWELFVPEGPPRKLFYLSLDAQNQAGGMALPDGIEMPPGRHIIEYQPDYLLDPIDRSRNRLLIDEQFQTAMPVFNWTAAGGNDSAIQELQISEPGEPFVIVGTGRGQQRLMWIDYADSITTIR